MIIDISRVESNLHTQCISIRVTNFAYPLIMLCSKFCSCLRLFSESCCTLIRIRTILDISIYYDAQYFIHFYAVLVQKIGFGLTNLSCLRVSKLPLCLFWNHTNVSPLCYPDFSQFFKQRESSIQTHIKSTYNIFTF